MVFAPGRRPTAPGRRDHPGYWCNMQASPLAAPCRLAGPRLVWRIVVTSHKVRLRVITVFQPIVTFVLFEWLAKVSCTFLRSSSDAVFEFIKTMSKTPVDVSRMTVAPIPLRLTFVSFPTIRIFGIQLPKLVVCLPARTLWFMSVYNNTDLQLFKNVPNESSLLLVVVALHSLCRTTDGFCFDFLGRRRTASWHELI